MIKYNYYRVTDGPCHEILMGWFATRRKLQSTYWAFIQSVGAVGYIPGWDDNVGNACAVIGVIFEGDLPAGWKRKKLRLNASLASNKVIGWPDKRSIIGKEAMKALKALPLCPSSNGPCKDIGFPLSLEYTGKSVSRGSTSLGFFETMSIGCIGDTFYVALPDERARRAELQAQGYTVKGDPWSPLPGMTQILREEMDLDYARDAAAQAAEATDAA